MIGAVWRKFLVTLLTLSVLLAVALIAARALLPRDRLAAEAVAAIEDATGAEVELGAVGLRVVGGLGLQLSDLRVRGTGEALVARTGAGRGIVRYDAIISRAGVAFSWSSLLARQPVPARIELQGPSLSWLTRGGDTWRLLDFELGGDDISGDWSGRATAGGAGAVRNTPLGLACNVRGRAARLAGAGTEFAALAVRGRWQDRRLAVSAGRATVGSGLVSVRGLLDYSQDPGGRAEWEGELDDVPATALLGPFLPDIAARLSCELSGRVSGALDLRDAETRLRTLSARGELAGGAGVLRADDWLQGAAPYLGARQDLMTVAFDRLSHSFQVDNGRYQIDELELDGSETDWQAAGWLGFAGDLAVRVAVRLPAGFTPDLGAMSFLAEGLRDPAGRVQLGFTVAGDMAEPRLGLDLGSLRRGR